MAVGLCFDSEYHIHLRENTINILYAYQVNYKETSPDYSQSLPKRLLIWSSSLWFTEIERAKPALLISYVKKI